MFLAFLRIIKYGFYNFWRSGWPSVATVTTIVVALLVFDGLVFVNVVGGKTLELLKNKIDISVYFKSDVEEDKILELKKKLEENLPEIKLIEYVSKEKALEIFKKKHKEEETITKALEELGENPLLASLNIKTDNPEDYAVVDAYLKQNEDILEIIERVSYAQNALVIERLSKIINTSKKAILFLTALFGVLAGVITFNTIRLAIYSNKDEIEIMRLIGASSFFIQGPYIIEGIIYGIVSALVSFLILVPIIYFVSPYLQIFVSEINLVQYFLDNYLSFVGYQVAVGIGLAVVFSFLAVRRYLKI